MPKINMVVSHCLSEDEALKRIKTLLGEINSQFNDKISDLREKWNGNIGKFSFSAMGFSISGMLIVKPSEVELSCNLPFVATLFEEKIESAIRERAKTLLI